MSNENIVKIIQDASVDAQSLSEFMYKPADFMVERRLAPAVHTFDYYLNALDGARDNVLAELQSIKDDMRVEADNAIAQMFESGGLPATPFATKSLMEASELTDGSYAVVTDDEEPLNRGFYLLSEGVWIKSLLDFRNIIKDKLSVFTDFDEMVSNLGEYSNGDLVLLKEGYDRDYLYKKTDTGWVEQSTSIEQAILNTFEIKKYKNLFYANKVLKNYLLDNSGKLGSTTLGQWSTSDYIPVEAGKMYAISGSRERHGLSFFKDMTSPDEPISYTTSAIPAIFTAPEGAKYLVLNLTNTDFTAFSSIMVEESEEHSGYSPNSGLYLNIPKSSLPEDTVYKSELIEKTAKNYEIAVSSENLFNKEDILQDTFIGSSGTNKLSTAAGTGWQVSNYIPVEENTSYTITGRRSRRSVAFYADVDGVPSDDALSYHTGSATNEEGVLTVLSPPDAKYMVVSLTEPGAAAPYTFEDVVVVRGWTAPEEYIEYGVNAYIDATYLKNTDKVLKDYEVYKKSPNLFNPSEVQQDTLIVSTPSVQGELGYGKGWVTTGYIPVKPNTQYTLTAKKLGRGGWSFFTNDDYDATCENGYRSPNTALHQSFISPPNAKFLVIGLATATNPEYEDIMITEGSEVIPYVPYGGETLIDSSYIIEGGGSRIGSGKSIEISDNNHVTLRSNGLNSVGLNIEHNLYAKRPDTHNIPNTFNLRDVSISGVVKGSGDDVAPIHADNATIGANHGYSWGTCNISDHDKLEVDAGSLWEDAEGKQYVLARVDGNTLTISSYDSNSHSGLAGATLNHISGATNTSPISVPSNVTFKQFYPSNNGVQTRFSVDGVQTDLAPKSLNFKNTVKFDESYEICARQDIMDYIVSNVGTQVEDFSGAEGSVIYDNSFEFDRDLNCVIYSSLTGLKSFIFKDFMGTQSTRYGNAPWRFYFPKTKLFTHADGQMDFANIQTLNSTLSSSVFLSNLNREDGANPPDRFMIFSNTGEGVVLGILPVLDGSPERREIVCASNYLELRGNTLKLYPRVVDSSSITTIEDGDNYSAVIYRAHVKMTENRTAYYCVRSSYGDFLFVDWHKPLRDKLEIPSDLVGKPFTIHEKSDNVTLHSKTATSTMLVDVDNSKSYGYLVLKFPKVS